MQRITAWATCLLHRDLRLTAPSIKILSGPYARNMADSSISCRLVEGPAKSIKPSLLAPTSTTSPRGVWIPVVFIISPVTSQFCKSPAAVAKRVPSLT